MAIQYFEGKRILITGASGFIGHALATSLSRIDCSITRSSRSSDSLRPLSGAAQITDAVVDYSDSAIWQELVAGMDIIFFLAAQTSASDANHDPSRDFKDNVLPLLNLLEYCRDSGTRPSIVFASTATVVGLTDQLPVSEGIYENPITVYDIHKLCCEKYLSYYSQNRYINSCALRLANVYGPGTASSSADRGILNMMMRRAIQCESLSIFGDGQQLRDYTYISDVVSAFEAAAIHIDKTNGRYFNIGCAQGHNFVDAFKAVAECVSLKLGHETLIEHIAAPANLALIETRSYVADTTNFTAATGWSAQVDLHSGIQRTIEQLVK